MDVTARLEETRVPENGAARCGRQCMVQMALAVGCRRPFMHACVRGKCLVFSESRLLLEHRGSHLGGIFSSLCDNSLLCVSFIHIFGGASATRVLVAPSLNPSLPVQKAEAPESTSLFRRAGQSACTHTMATNPACHSP